MMKIGTLLNTIGNFFKGIYQQIIDAFRIFGKPHHSSTLSIRGLLLSVLGAIIVASVAFLFKPFGLKDLSNDTLLDVVVTITGISFIVMLVTQFILPFIIKDFYAEENWTTGKQLAQLLIMSFLISLAVVYYASTRSLADFPTDSFILFGASILPLAIVAVIQQLVLRNSFVSKAAQKTQDLQHKNVILPDNPLKVLNFKSGSEKLHIVPNQLIYIKLGSPSEFYYQNLLGVKKSNLSVSEKEIIDEVNNLPQFVRFKNNYIININAIQSVTGSGRGYDIQIARVNEMVMVSHKDKKRIEKL